MTGRFMYAIKKFYEKKFKAVMPGIFPLGVYFFDGNWDKAYDTLDLSEKNVMDLQSLDNFYDSS